MNPFSKYRNQIILGILIAVALYVVTLLFFDSQGQVNATEGVLSAISRFPVLLIPVLIFFQLGVIFFRFVEWHYYLGVIGARDKISLFDSLIIFTAGFTMVVSPGKAAEVLKAVFLKAKTSVPIAQGASVVLAERVVDGLAVIVLLVVTLIVSGGKLNLGSSNGVDYDGLSQTIILSSAFILALGLIAVQIRPLANFALAIIKRLPVIRRLHDPLVVFYEMSREVFKLRHVIPMTCVGMGVYSASSLGFYCVLLAYGLEPTSNLLFQAFFITGIVSAIGALSFVPNGAGITEVTTAGMLLAVVAPVNPVLTLAIAYAISLIQGFFHKWLRVLIGMLVMIIFRNRLFSAEFSAALLEYETEKQSNSAD